MLVCLRVRNFAIVEELELVLERGLNVVTGETGAGKSILVHALELVLGARARPEALRGGAEQAEVEALFDVSDDAAARARAEATGVAIDDQLVLRRVVPRDGRSRAYIDGKLASVAQLADLARGLCDISSQHEHDTLADAGSHLGFLDAFAGLDAARDELRRAHAALVEARHALDAHRGTDADRDARLDLLRYQVGELDALAPEAGEDVLLREERERLRHAERLRSAAGGAEDALYARDDAVCAELARVGHALEEAAAFDASLGPLAERVGAAQAELEDLARELGVYTRGVSSDPARLAEVEERLDAIERLSRKHGGSLETTLAWADTAREELGRLDRGEEETARLHAEWERARTHAGDLAHALSKRRKRAATKLGKAIGDELRSLSMGEARVAVEVAAGSEGEPLADGARLGPTGIDRVEFLLAANPGEQARPLRQIASGGELSRAMLAVKRVLRGLGPGGLYVFDEVDAGVGGAVAEVVGRKLREVARHHQVVCITHLPQIAVFGDAHYRVHKGIADGRTRSDVERLDGAARREEIARMLGGVEVGEKTRAAAKELLRRAEEAR